MIVNNKRRKYITSAINLLSEAYLKIEDVLDEERDSLDNMPSNLETSEKYINIENAIEYLEGSLERIDEAKEFAEEAIA